MKDELAEQLREEMRQEREQIRQEREEMRLERQAMMEAFDKRLESLMVSQKLPQVVQPDISPPPVRVSTKGSCSAATEARGETDFGSQCELYTLVDYASPPQLVAYGKCFEGSAMLHGQCLPSHLVKVTVETICIGDAAVPIPTSEVGIVSQALGTFIAWPKHLLRMTPDIEMVCICSNTFTYVLNIILINIKLFCAAT